MVVIKNILLFAVAASAAAIHRRSTSEVMSDLESIDSDVNSLTSSINGWDGSDLGALSIEEAEDTLASQIKSTTSDVTSTGSFDDADAASLLSYITGTITPDVKTALAALDSKASEVSSDGLTSDVEGGVNDLKTDTDALFAALISAFPADKTAAAKAAQSTIDGYFATAISTYS